MGQHYTLNTVSVEGYCNKCGKNTQHRVTNRRRGPCMECIERLDEQKAVSTPKAQQKGLFE